MAIPNGQDDNDTSLVFAGATPTHERMVRRDACGTPPTPGSTTATSRTATVSSSSLPLIGPHGLAWFREAISAGTISKSSPSRLLDEALRSTQKIAAQVTGGGAVRRRTCQ